MTKIGIIGGSGLYQIEGLRNVKELPLGDTPFGKPSDHLIAGDLEGSDVVFLARHGRGHTISPSCINYRANIFEMKRLGVEAIISVSACGSLREIIKPMDFVVPDQFVDRTNKARESSFFTEGIVVHVALADPVAPELTKILVEAAKEVGVAVHPKGTYINMEGPQFSTRAESRLYRQWGMDIIGMTNMPEAKLAREAEISYASLCAVTDYDCWYEGHEEVSVEMILEYLHKNVENAKRILKKAIPRIGKLNKFSASEALKYAIVTKREYVSQETKNKLKVIWEKYLG